MKKEFDEVQLMNEIPQIQQIQDEGLREKTILAWRMAYEDSNFEDLPSVLFSPYYAAPTLLGHTKAVTEASIQLARIVQEAHGYEIDMDALICISVLHDISKLREYDPAEDGTIQKSPIGMAYQHAFFSAHYAIEVGIPDKIVAAIFAHTGNTKTLPTSLEGILVTYGDMADADMHRFVHGRPLHVAKIHKG